MGIVLWTDAEDVKNNPGNNIMVPLNQLFSCLANCYSGHTLTSCQTECSPSNFYNYLQNYLSYPPLDPPTSLLRQYLESPVSLEPNSKSISDFQESDLEKLLTSNSPFVYELMQYVKAAYQYYSNASTYSITEISSSNFDVQNYTFSIQNCSDNSDGKDCCSRINTICGNNAVCIYPTTNTSSEQANYDC
jgi:hypothetical protein